VKSRIRIRIKVKFQELSRLKKEPGGPWTLKMEALMGEDPDRDPHLNEKLDPDPQ
jgi:hypothetical protein